MALNDWNSTQDLVPSFILYSVLLFSWGKFAWEAYLRIRQRRVYRKNTRTPPELEAITNDETFDKARSYALDKLAFDDVEAIFSQILSTILIWCFAFKYVWDVSEHVNEDLIGIDRSEIYQSMTFLLIFNLFSTVIDLPFSIYGTFILEERHGFNKQTASFYIKDQIKRFTFGQVMTLPLAALIISIIKWCGPYFFVYLWGAFTIITMFFMIIHPQFIAPLFDNYKPLPEGQLRKDIEDLAASIQFPLYNIFVVDGSKRSSHSNAYFYGFFSFKRIVLYDTLLEQEEREKIKTADVANKDESLQANKEECNSNNTDDTLLEVDEREKIITEKEEKYQMMQKREEECESNDGNDTLLEEEDHEKISTAEEKKKEAMQTKKEQCINNNTKDVLLEKGEREKITTDEENDDEGMQNKKRELESNVTNNTRTETTENKGCSRSEILAVLGHELGHWKLNHVFKNLVISELHLFLMFTFFGYLYHLQPLYTAFGFSNQQPVLIGLIIILQFITVPYNAVLEFGMTALSRHFEFQADNFAKSLGKGEKLCAALIKLNNDNLSCPIYDGLYSAWHHSHPPLSERLTALKQKKKYK